MPMTEEAEALIERIKYEIMALRLLSDRDKNKQQRDERRGKVQGMELALLFAQQELT